MNRTGKQDIAHQKGTQQFCAGQVSRKGNEYLSTREIGSPIGCLPDNKSSCGLHLVESSGKKECDDSECPPENVAVQVSSCSKCLSLLLLMTGGKNSTCVRCEQMDDLLSMVAKLKEEVEKLRRIKECEQEIGWWSNSAKIARKTLG